MARYSKLKLSKLIILVVLLTVVHGLSDSWQQCSAPEGGDVSSLASCGPYLFAGTMGNGVLRWSESAGQWEKKNDGIGNLFIYSMAAVDTVLFVGTMGNGLCRTLDYGETWERVWYDRNNWDFTVRTVAAIEDAVFAISRRSDAAVRSRDHGVTWERLSFLQYHNHFVPRYFAESSGSIFVGTRGGVLRSTDGGDTWEEASAGLSVPVYHLAAADSVLVAGTYRGGIYVSHNEGSSWAPSTDGIEAVSHKTVNALAAHNGVVYAGISGRIYSSQDRGSTWETSGDTAEAYYAKNFVGYHGEVYVADCGGGVLRLDQSTRNWSKLNSGLSAHTVTDLLVNSDILWATSWYGGLFSMSPACTNSVLEYRAVLPSYQCVAVDNDKTLYCGTANGLFRRAFGQDTWEEDNLGIPIPPADSNMLARVSSMWFGDSLEFVAVSGILYRRPTGSKQWKPSSKDPQGAGGISHVLFVDGRVLAGGAGLHVSEDTCKTWRRVIAEDGGIKSIVARDSLVLCANFFHGVYHSTDAGSTWEKPNQKLGRVEALAFVGQTCFAGTKSQGLFVSHDTARTWVPVGDVPDDVPILSMAVSDSVLYLGTDGWGVWTYDVREMSASARAVLWSSSKPKSIVPPGREGFDLRGRKLISPKRATSISVDETRKYFPLAK